MLTSLALTRFSLFAEAKLDVTTGMNVIVGENSTGKSHLLKLAYVLSALQSESSEETAPEIHFHLDERIAEKLVAVFRPDFLGGLVNRSANRSPDRASGRSRCVVHADFQGHALRFSFAPNSRKKVIIEAHTPSKIAKPPVMLPPKEALSLFPSLVGSYERRELPMDETYYDLCRKFQAGALKLSQLDPVTSLIRELEAILRGKVLLENGRFHLKTHDKGKLEISLLAEGLRKIAQLAYLLLNGSLCRGCTLFWDEPDSNLNPKLIRKVAKALLATAQAGIQVVIATHSLFLLRELTLLNRSHAVPTLFTGLEYHNSGVVAHQDENIEGLPNIAALEEELDQSDRYLEQHLETDRMQDLERNLEPSEASPRETKP
ncbi:AAA family ATPase [Desulfonatronum thioautotrophicum]|uniref:AAA family ATPase n=1 Tax=Desulfonatronum thioautotrophicum TaxID=617001 RepID=UPI00069A8B27|nr:ATP-binding protein [Desulfonatronum thioautotrophicum]